eukprot:scaffold85616_cov50-Phaeocystis_antarctica.AAC.2
MGVEVDDQEKTWWVVPEGEAQVGGGGRGPEADGGGGGGGGGDAGQRSAARGGVTRVTSFATRVQAVPYSRSPNCRVDLSRQDRDQIEDRTQTQTLAPNPNPHPNPNPSPNPNPNPSPAQARLRADRGPHDAAARGQAQARLASRDRVLSRTAVEQKYEALVSRVSDHRALDSHGRALRRPAPGWRPHLKMKWCPRPVLSLSSCAAEESTSTTGGRPLRLIWLTPHGSWLMAHGPWLMTHVSRLMAHAWAHGPWPMAHVHVHVHVSMSMSMSMSPCPCPCPCVLSHDSCRLLRLVAEGCFQGGQGGGGQGDDDGCRPAGPRSLYELRRMRCAASFLFFLH